MTMGRTCAGPGCTAPLPETGRGRAAVFCSGACRSRAHRHRNAGKPPRPAEVIPLPRAAGPAGWDPPSQPRAPYETAEPCPGCAGPLTAGRRGTWRACLHCGHGVTPAAVSAPYARGERAPQRQVMSQAERDLAALELVRRKGVMLAQLGQLAGDDRLAEESRPLVEWFRDEVKASRTENRLDELASLLPKAGIRRRHWWQGQSAAIEAPGWDDEDDYDGEDQDGDEDQAPDYPHAIEAAPAARPAELTWADAMDACGWQLTPTVGGCQVVIAGQVCGAETRHAVAGRHVRDAWVCTSHYYALCKIITQARRSA